MLERTNRVEAINLARGNIFGALDQPLLVAAPEVACWTKLKDGGGVSKPAANAADDRIQGQPPGVVAPRFWLSSTLPAMIGRCSTGSKSLFLLRASGSFCHPARRTKSPSAGSFRRKPPLGSLAQSSVGKLLHPVRDSADQSRGGWPRWSRRHSSRSCCAGNSFRTAIRVDISYCVELTDTSALCRAQASVFAFGLHSCWTSGVSRR